MTDHKAGTSPGVGAGVRVRGIGVPAVEMVRLSTLVSFAFIGTINEYAKTTVTVFKKNDYFIAVLAIYGAEFLNSMLNAHQEWLVATRDNQDYAWLHWYPLILHPEIRYFQDNGMLISMVYSIPLLVYICIGMVG